MAYWTTEPETPKVWHDNTDCPNGKQILASNKVTGSPPSDRVKCKDC